MEELREFVITCSMFEIYLDKVRDLGSAFLEKSVASPSSKSCIKKYSNNNNKKESNYKDENLEIYENTNG